MFIFSKWFYCCAPRMIRFARPYSSGQLPLQPLLGGNDSRWGFAICHSLSPPPWTSEDTNIDICTAWYCWSSAMAVLLLLSADDETHFQQIFCTRSTLFVLTGVLFSYLIYGNEAWSKIWRFGGLVCSDRSSLPYHVTQGGRSWGNVVLSLSQAL